MASFPKTLGLTVDIRTVAVDKGRNSLSVFNKHTTAIVYMKEGGQVSTASGIPIYPTGNVSLTLSEDGKSVQEAWSFISDTAGTEVVIFEG